MARLPDMKPVFKTEQFVTDANGARVAVLFDLKTYDRLRESEEDLAEIRAYDSARLKVHQKLKNGKVDSLSDYLGKKARF